MKRSWKLLDRDDDVLESFCSEPDELDEPVDLQKGHTMAVSAT